MPDSSVLSFTDPYEHQTSIRNGEVRMLATSPGPYRAELTRIELHGLWMQRSREFQPRVAHVAIAAGRRPIYFLAYAEQGPSFHSGVEQRPEHVIFYSPGAEHHLRAPTQSRWAAMSLAPDALVAAGRAIAGHELVAPTVTQRVRPPPRLLSRLRNLHAAAGHLAATTPDILAHPEVARAMEQELIRAMVGCLTEGAIVEDKAVGHRRLAVMRRFEQILDESVGRPRYMAEICAALGVAERTLRLHCLEHLGMNPQRYLWLRRMHQARQALARTDPTAATVTAIATDHGFWELGRFAVAYRKLFGESPSVTLRSAPDRRSIELSYALPTGRLPILP